MHRLWAKFLGVSQFGSNLLITIATNVTLGGLGAISGILAARLLGVEGRGELAAIQIKTQQD
jgi:uncharacterized membrane protein